MKRNGSEKIKMKSDGDFELLFSEFKTPIFNYLRVMCKNQSEAEDLFQEAFIKVHRSMDQLDAIENRKAWVYKIALNCFRDHRRKKVTKTLWIHDEEQWIDEQKPIEFLEMNETKHFLNKKISQLSPKLKEVFILRVDHAMTFKEIAESLGEPIDRVLKRMQMAVKTLKESYQRWEGSLENV